MYVCVCFNIVTPQLCSYLWVVCIVAELGVSHPYLIEMGEETVRGILLSFSLAGRKRLGTPAGSGRFTTRIVSMWERVS